MHQGASIGLKTRDVGPFPPTVAMSSAEVSTQDVRRRLIILENATGIDHDMTPVDLELACFEVFDGKCPSSLLLTPDSLVHALTKPNEAV